MLPQSGRCSTLGGTSSWARLALCIDFFNRSSCIYDAAARGLLTPRLSCRENSENLLAPNGWPGDTTYARARVENHTYSVHTLGTYVHTSIHTCHLVHPQRRFVLARSVLYYYWAVTYRTLPTNHSTAAAARPPVYILNTCGASVQRVMVFHPITPCACPSRESSE